jgi:short-subunit dehydrogenase
VRALVTGASSGIGRALLPWFAKDGYELVVVARRRDALDEAARAMRDAHRAKVDVIAMDLAQPGAAHALFAKTGAVDVLVNNAGFGMYGEFAEENIARVSQMIALNVAALTELTHAYLAPMLAQKSGRILQVSSTAAFQPGPRMASYYATKAYVLAFSEALAVEIDGSGVTVTTLCPGPTKSEFNAIAGYTMPGYVERAAMSSEEVAAIGYRALMKGERTVVAGAANKAMAVASRVGPRSLVLAVTDRLLRSRE